MIGIQYLWLLALYGTDLRLSGFYDVEQAYTVFMGTGYCLFVMTEILSSWFSSEDFQERRAVMDSQSGKRLILETLGKTFICISFKMVKKPE